MALVLGDPLLFQNASTIRSYFDGRADKIPVMFGAPESADNGALVAVGPSHESLFRRGAYFVRQLLKSLQTVAQLKIEGPKASDIEIVINHQARTAGKWPDFPTKVKTRKRARHIH
jgi:ABC-type uncharacterized transport system substrate-binding protein